MQTITRKTASSAAADLVYYKKVTSGCFLLFFGCMICATHYFQNVRNEKAEVHRLRRSPIHDEKHSCGESIFVADKDVRTISSPNNNGIYFSNLNCKWLLEASEGHRINLLLHEGNIEDTDDCTADYVEIAEGNDIIGRFCGRFPKRLIKSKSNKISVIFVSDEGFDMDAFKLSYSLLVENDCNRTITSGKGVITSPGYPYNYPNNADCWTYLQVLNPEDEITLNFDMIDMEMTRDCENDYVELFEGLPPDLGSRLGRACDRTSNLTSQPIVGSSFVIHFHSDHSESKRGFTLKYFIADKNYSEKHPEIQAHKCSNDDPKPSNGFSVVMPHNISLAEGQSYALPCGSNDRTAYVKWMKNLNVLTKHQESLPGLALLSNHTLLITDMSWKLEGRYTCIVVLRGEVNAVDVWIKLIDTYKPKSCKLRFQYVPQDKALMENSFTYLRCSAQDAKVTWKKDGLPIRKDRNTNVKILPGLLLINKAVASNSGNYMCNLTHRPTVGRLCSVQKTVYVSVEPLVHQRCGVATTPTVKPCQKEGKMLGGKTAANGSAPWQVMLSEQQVESFCGGSLIAHEWVVTAAHCIADFARLHNRSISTENLFVKLGKYVRNKKEPHEKTEGVRTIILHPEFDSRTLHNDIALIRIKKPVNFSWNIMPICLGNARQLNSRLKEPKTVGRVTGWGELIEKGLLAYSLKEIRLPIVKDEVCNNSIEFSMTENMFCAGFAEEVMEDSCKGDSGGPFAVQESNRWYLAGIVSWGKGCGRQGHYGFYTRVGNYYNWIKNIMDNPEANIP